MTSNPNGAEGEWFLNPYRVFARHNPKKPAPSLDYLTVDHLNDLEHDAARVQVLERALQQIADKRTMNWLDYREKWGDIPDACGIAIAALSSATEPATSEANDGNN